MRKLIFKEIDNKKVFLKLDTALIDPRASSLKIKNLVEKTDEFKVFNKLLEEAKNLKTRPSEEFKQRFLKGKNSLITKTKSLSDKTRVYFLPKENELLITKEEAKEYRDLSKSLKKHELLLIDKTKIKNLKGAIYFELENGSYTKKSISKIGDSFPAGHIKELPPGHEMDGFSEDEKRDLYKKKKDELVLKSVLIREESELGGKSPSKAKDIASDFYDKEILILNNKFGL